MGLCFVRELKQGWLASPEEFGGYGSMELLQLAAQALRKLWSRRGEVSLVDVEYSEGRVGEALRSLQELSFVFPVDVIRCHYVSLHEVMLCHVIVKLYQVDSSCIRLSYVILGYLGHIWIHLGTICADLARNVIVRRGQDMLDPGISRHKRFGCVTMDGLFELRASDHMLMASDGI